MASHSRYLREGIIAGFIGAAIVAVWFLIYDAARGRPFRTPALLGAATFQGVADPATVPTATHQSLPASAFERLAPPHPRLFCGRASPACFLAMSFMITNNSGPLQRSGK